MVSHVSDAQFCDPLNRDVLPLQERYFTLKDPLTSIFRTKPLFFTHDSPNQRGHRSNQTQM